jgi:uncharacterized protein involved in exopolysaccharide biosynthesis
LASPRGLTSSPQFYAELLQSREVLREAVSTVYDVGAPAPFRGTLVEYYRIRSSDSSTAVLRAVARLRSALVVRTDRALGITKFQIRTRNPLLSTRVASRLLELVNHYNLQERQAQARAEREFMEQRLSQARQELAAAEDALAGFYVRNRRYQDSPDLVAQEARLQRHVTLQQQLYVTLAQSYEMAQIEEMRDTPVIMVIERPEGFVEPLGRGLVVRVLTALLIGVLLAIGLAFGAEYLFHVRQQGGIDYQDFVAVGRRVRAGLPRWLPGRLRG